MQFKQKLVYAALGTVLITFLASCAPKQTEKFELVPATPKENYWALLVGIDDYQSDKINDLMFTRNDVEQFKKTLILAGYPEKHVLLMTSKEKGLNHPTHNNLLFQVDKLSQNLAPDDLLVFYFSGHGITKDGQSYLLTINTDPRSMDTLKITSIPLDILKEKLKRINANKLFLIDACRNDPERGKGTTDNLLTEAFTKELIIEPTERNKNATLFACSPGERAFEWPEKKHGVFTYYLLEYLRETEETPTVDSLVKYLDTKVSEWSNENGLIQKPWLSGDADINFASTIPKVLRHSTLPSTLIYKGDFRHGVSTEYWDKAFGLWRTSKEHGLTVQRGGVALVWFRKPLADFTMECDAKAIQGGGLSIVVSGLGKGARFDTGYQIAFGEIANQRTFLKRRDTVVLENNKELIEHDKTYRIKVRKYGATIQFYLDNRLIFDYTDPSPLKGQYHQFLGLGGDEGQFTTIAYDNVKIYRE